MSGVPKSIEVVRQSLDSAAKVDGDERHVDDALTNHNLDDGDEDERDEFLLNPRPANLEASSLLHYQQWQQYHHQPSMTPPQKWPTNDAQQMQYEQWRQLDQFSFHNGSISQHQYSESQHQRYAFVDDGASASSVHPNPPQHQFLPPIDYSWATHAHAPTATFYSNGQRYDYKQQQIPYNQSPFHSWNNSNQLNNSSSNDSNDDEQSTATSERRFLGIGPNRCLALFIIFVFIAIINVVVISKIREADQQQNSYGSGIGKSDIDIGGSMNEGINVGIVQSSPPPSITPLDYSVVTESPVYEPSSSSTSTSITTPILPSFSISTCLCKGTSFPEWDETMRDSNTLLGEIYTKSYSCLDENVVVEDTPLLICLSLDEAEGGSSSNDVQYYSSPPPPNYQLRQVRQLLLTHPTTQSKFQVIHPIIYTNATASGNNITDNRVEVATSPWASVGISRDSTFMVISLERVLSIWYDEEYVGTSLDVDGLILVDHVGGVEEERLFHRGLRNVLYGEGRMHSNNPNNGRTLISTQQSLSQFHVSGKLTPLMSQPVITNVCLCEGTKYRDTGISYLGAIPLSSVEDELFFSSQSKMTSPPSSYPTAPLVDTKYYYNCVEGLGIAKDTPVSICLSINGTEGHEHQIEAMRYVWSLLIQSCHLALYLCQCFQCFISNRTVFIIP